MVVSLRFRLLLILIYGICLLQFALDPLMFQSSASGAGADTRMRHYRELLCASLQVTAVHVPTVVIDMIMSYACPDTMIIAGGPTNDHHQQSLMLVYVSEFDRPICHEWRCSPSPSSRTNSNDHVLNNVNDKGAVPVITTDITAKSISKKPKVKKAALPPVVQQIPVRACATSAYIAHYLMIVGLYSRVFPCSPPSLPNLLVCDIK
jgi:hypothetical protein